MKNLVQHIIRSRIYVPGSHPATDDTYYLGTATLGWKGIHFPNVALREADSGTLGLYANDFATRKSLYCKSIQLDDTLELGVSDYIRSGAADNVYYDLAAYNGSAFVSAIRVQNDTTGAKAEIGLYAATPTPQQAHIADPTGGATIDTECRAAVNNILTQLATIGIHAAS